MDCGKVGFITGVIKGIKMLEKIIKQFTMFYKTDYMVKLQYGKGVSGEQQIIEEIYFKNKMLDKRVYGKSFNFCVDNNFYEDIKKGYESKLNKEK